MGLLIIVCIVIVIITGIVECYFPICGLMPDMEDDKYIYKDAGPEYYWRYNKKSGKWKLKP